MKRVFQKHLGWLLPALVLGAATAAADESDEALKFLQSSVDEVMKVVYDHDETAGRLSDRLKPLLTEHFDLAGITRRSVGRPWLKFTPAQQEQAIDLFSTLVLRTYADRFEPKKRPAIDYGKGVKLAEGRWELPTTIEYEGSRYAVAYRVESGKTGWRIYDVVIEGVSMIGNYRAQFDAIVNKGGAPALLDALEENIARAQAAKQP